MPSDGHSDYSPEPADDGGRRVDRTGVVQAETRDREECYTDLRVAVCAEEGSKGPDAADPRDRDADGERFRGEWAEHQRSWPVEERPPVDRSGDPPGSSEQL